MPIPLAKQRQLSRKINDLIKQGDKLDTQASRVFLKTLKDTQSRLVQEIKLADDWELANLIRIRGRLDGIIDTFPEEMLSSVDDLSGKAWDLGKEIVDSPLDVAGIRPAIQEIPTATLLAMRGTTDEAIAGLTADMRSKVRVSINQALLGEVSPFRAAQKIQVDIGGIRNRGEKIIRTEVGTIQSVATRLRLEQSKEFVPGLKQQWITSVRPTSRPSHIAINGQIRNIGQPFDLRNDRTGEIEHPMQPRDPILSGYNRVNCGCNVAPHHEDWV